MEPENYKIVNKPFLRHREHFKKFQKWLKSENDWESKRVSLNFVVNFRLISGFGKGQLYLYI